MVFQKKITKAIYKCEKLVIVFLRGVKMNTIIDPPDKPLPSLSATPTDILKRIDKKIYIQNKILEELVESLRDISITLDSLIQERAIYED